MRLDLFRTKSVKPADSSGLQVVPTEAVPDTSPEVVRPSHESYPEVVPSDTSFKSKTTPVPNKDITLEVAPTTSPEFDQPGLEIPSHDIPPFTSYPSQPQIPQSQQQQQQQKQQQQPPQPPSQRPPPSNGTYTTIVPAYHPPQIHPTQGGPVIQAPSLWELRYDPPNNTPYYINHTTKATSWFLPPGDLLESQVDLPPGWEIRFTFDGQRYFFDRASNAVSFKDPRVFKRPVFLQGGGGGELRGRKDVPRNGRTGEPLGKLPAGWTRKVDTAGRAYFVDGKGKVCSFEDPRSGMVEYERGRGTPREMVVYK